LAVEGPSTVEGNWALEPVLVRQVEVAVFGKAELGPGGTRDEETEKRHQHEEKTTRHGRIVASGPFPVKEN